MASYTTIEDWTAVERGYVVDVTIRHTTAETYPSGWDYGLHFGEVGGDTILRYDNAHERTAGHERHTQVGVEPIKFPGMLALYDRFKRKVDELSPVCWDWTESEAARRNTMSTLTVTVGERDRLDERTRDRIAAAEDGGDLDDAQPVLNFESYAALSRLLSPKNLELLDAISEHQPGSIREAADRVDRDYKQVHRNLAELEDIGVIEFDGGGQGRAKTPTLAYDGLEIDIPFAGTSGRAGTATP